MKIKHAVPFDEVLAKLRHDEDFRKAERQLKPYYDVVKAIFNRRKELGLTQKDLSAKANTYQSRISKIESAEHDIRLSTLIQIAEALKSEVSIKLVPYEEASSYERIDTSTYFFFKSVKNISLRPCENTQIDNGEKAYVQDYEISV